MKAITRSPRVLVLSVESDITPTVMLLMERAAAQCEFATDIDEPLRYVRGPGCERTSGRRRGAWWGSGTWTASTIRRPRNRRRRGMASRRRCDSLAHLGDER